MATASPQMRRGDFTAEMRGEQAPSNAQRQKQMEWQQELQLQAEAQRLAKAAEIQREKEKDRRVRAVCAKPPPATSARCFRLLVVLFTQPSLLPWGLNARAAVHRTRSGTRGSSRTRTIQ